MIIIADDITGAAEIAGIAFERGRQVRLVCSGSVCCDHVAAQTIVMATDTRSMSEAEAAAENQRIASAISHQPSAIFKKTDSALRGHVVAELTTLMAAAGYQRAVYLPANPSKGRIIRQGIYYINNVPIHETAFSYDPEFPAKSAVLKERFPDAEANGIIMPDAENMDDIQRVIAEYNDGKTIFAGAADLFTALLPPLVIPLTSQHSPLTSKNVLILCGSTQSKPLELGIPIAPMPREIYDGKEDISLWDTHAYAKAHSLILTMPYSHRTGKEAAVHLRTVMARKAKELIAQHCPDHLVIEGGATAWATLQVLGWSQFEITCQITPGVVQMKSVTNGILVTLKPGSYPWGAMFESVTT